MTNDINHDQHHGLVKQSYQDSEIAESYDDTRFKSFWGRSSNNRDIRMIISAVEAAVPSAESSVLDVACGTGRITEALAKKYPSVTGCDGSQDMIDVARQKAALANLEFHVADATNLPFEDDSFDCVTSVRFVGHLDRDSCRAFFAECARVSRKAVVVDVCINNPLTNGRRWLKKKISGSYLGFSTEWQWRTFERSELEEDLKASGLRIKSMSAKLPVWSDVFVITCVAL